MHDDTFTDRLRYRFDNLMARGPSALVGLLALASAAFVVGGGLIAWGTGIAPEGEPPLGFVEATWAGLMRTLDAGTMGGDAGWSWRALALVTTFGGIFVVSAFIGVLTTGLEAKLEDLREGRSRVIERDHVVVLGWSEQVFPILRELVVANANQRSSCVVVLGTPSRVEMEEAIRAKVGDLGRTRVVCRTGSPTEPVDLELVNLRHARSIVVLSPPDDDPDVGVIKTLLAITHQPGRREEPYHLVAELRDPKNLDVARIAGGSEAELVVVGDLVARVMAQTCRQSGLSVVYTELLDFDGDEIYFHGEPSLAAATFGDVLLRFEDSSVLGVHPDGGAPRLNPPMDTVLGPRDRLIVVSEDDDTVRLAPAPASVDPSAIRTGPRQPEAPERTLVLGWNARAPALLEALDAYVPPGSTALVVADDDRVAGALDGVPRTRLRIAWQAGDATDRATLEALDVAAFDHLVVLCDSDRLDADRADARTLMTLLHLRDMADRTGRRVPVVSEMLDLRNRRLAEIARADDFIVSDELVSLMMAQVAENRHLHAVFADLFDPEGSEVYLKPVGDYVAPGVEVGFATVVEAARRRGEVAFGYRLADAAREAGKAYGVVVNPAKSSRVRFGEGDKVIVLAES